MSKSRPSHIASTMAAGGIVTCKQNASGLCLVEFTRLGILYELYDCMCARFHVYFDVV